jgi:hypothetical protein
MRLLTDSPISVPHVPQPEIKNKKRVLPAATLLFMIFSLQSIVGWVRYNFPVIIDQNEVSARTCDTKERTLLVLCVANYLLTS